jgi:uncharacterized membrane protein
MANAQATLAVLAGVAGLFFFLERQFRWKIFEYLPPLIFIYTIPVALGNTGVIQQTGPLYDGLKTHALPVFITLMLLEIDFVAVVRVVGRGILVMLMGTVGVVIRCDQDAV